MELLLPIGIVVTIIGGAHYLGIRNSSQAEVTGAAPVRRHWTYVVWCVGLLVWALPAWAYRSIVDLRCAPLSGQEVLTFRLEDGDDAPPRLRSVSPTAAELEAEVTDVRILGVFRPIEGRRVTIAIDRLTGEFAMRFARRDAATGTYVQDGLPIQGTCARIRRPAI